MVTDLDVDFAHTREAERQRTDKAKTLAGWCWVYGVDPTEIGSWDEPVRRRVSREAKVHAPSTWETWARVVGMLETKREWIERNPGLGVPEGSLGRPEWLPPLPGEVSECERGVNALDSATDRIAPRVGADEDPRVAKMISSADAEEENSASGLADSGALAASIARHPASGGAGEGPRGWAELVASGVELGFGRRCGVAGCIAPAIAATVTILRCAKHPPRAGEWGSRLDFTPRERTCAPNRCYCGRHESWRPAPTPAALLDGPPASSEQNRDGANKARQALTTARRAR